jgi:UDP-N-acetylglucosamine 2-epimerase (non-hydrolysing)
MAMKVMAIFGTRPEAIKLAPVIKEMEKHPAEFDLVVTVTAQHREMLDQVLTLFDIVPDYDLDIMKSEQNVFQVTSRVLLGLEPLLRQEQPDLVLVQGDTTTVMAAALAAFYLKIPVGHVEAGLRTYDKFQPFPEEINRRLVSHIADWHFAPTPAARDNLLREGIPPERIFVTGNTVVDAILAVVRPNYVFGDPVLGQLDFDARKVILATTHRRENWGEPIRSVCQAIRYIVGNFSEVEIVYAVHLNPKVQRAVKTELEGVERVHLLGPLDYESFAHLMSQCYLILTDSGGIQEEAPSLGVPVLVLRNVTERPEGVDAGTLKVVGTETDVIVQEAARLLTDPVEYSRMASASNPYGDGRASQRIIDVLTRVGDSDERSATMDRACELASVVSQL